MLQYTLDKATEAHLKTVETWFQNQQELAQWGGPGLEFGVPLQVFAQQIKLAELQSFCLMRQTGICGFGQFFVRQGRHHLARLAIAPAQRGQRLACVLVQQLAGLAIQKQSAKGFSLFVLAQNTPALKTYQKLGFEFAPYPAESPVGLEQYRYMTASRIRAVQR